MVLENNKTRHIVLKKNRETTRKRYVIENTSWNQNDTTPSVLLTSYRRREVSSLVRSCQGPKRLHLPEPVQSIDNSEKEIDTSLHQLWIQYFRKSLNFLYLSQTVNLQRPSQGREYET